MPHIDEGTLHALLDGALGAGDRDHAERARAHLDSCADCRALLEAAEADRHRAGEILGALDADLDGIAEPDFDEVLVRGGALGGAGAEADRWIPLGGEPATAGRGTLHRRFQTQLRWTRGVAWAASLVIALGTGYLIRDRIMPERSAPMEMPAPPQSALHESAPRADGDEPATDAAADAALESADASAGDGATSSTTPPPPPAPAPAARQSAERDIPTDADASTGGGGAAGGAAEKSAEAVSLDRQRAEAVEEASRRSVLRALVDPPLGVSTAAAPSVAPTPAAPTPEAEDVAQAAAGSGAPAPASYATALAFVRGMHYTVPDRPVDRVEIYDVGGALGARTIQTLADGTTVVLLQRVMEGESPVLDLDALQAAVAADLPEAVRAELRSVMVRRGDQIVVVTAPLGESELRRVAEGLEATGG